MPDKTMQAAVVTQPGELTIQSIPTPQPGPFEALVQINVCGICSTTDRHLVAGKQCHHPAQWYPAVLGHEGVGTVIAVGKEVRKYKVGDRVTRPAAVWPGTQRDGLYSAWGGFAQYGIVRDRDALLAAGHQEYENDYTSQRQNVPPADLDPLDASLAISLAEIASWIWKLGPLGGQSLAVGGTGFAASAMCLFARLAGAGPVIMIGRRQEKLDQAARFGADGVINSQTEDVPARIRQLTGGHGAAYFAEATGVDATLEMGLKTLARGGTAAIYGAPENYSYSLPLRAGPGDFAVRLVVAEEHVAFARVCELLRRRIVDASLFRTKVWHGLEQLPQALTEHEQGQIVKGFIQISG